MAGLRGIVKNNMNYIFKTIILTIIFLALIYFFTFRKIRRKRKEDFDTLRDYHEAYDRKGSQDGTREKKQGRDYTLYSADSESEGRTDYVTKYNSTEDYRER